MRHRPAHALVIPFLLWCIVLAACRRGPEPPLAPPGPTAAERDAVARLPIQLDQNLGSDLRLAGYGMTKRPSDPGWDITLASKVLRIQPEGVRLWVHAYPPDSTDYLSLDPMRSSQPGQFGHIVMDTFALPQPGAYNLYVGEIRPDRTLGPPVPLGWIAVGNPATPEFSAALKTLVAKGAAGRAGIMLDQALRAHPGASVPDDIRRTVYTAAGRFDALLPDYQKQLADGWRPASIEDWLMLTAIVQASGWKEDVPALDAAVRDAAPPLRAVAAMVDTARQRARGQVASGTAAPAFQIGLERPATDPTGVRTVGTAVAPVAGSNRFRVYVFMQAERDSHDERQVWLHAYPARSASYDDWALQSVPYPTVLKAGHYTWRVFGVSKPGAYNVYDGRVLESGTLGPAAPLGWIAIGQPGSPAFVRALQTIHAEGQTPRALEIANGLLREYPKNPALERIVAELARPAKRAVTTPAQN